MYWDYGQRNLRFDRFPSSAAEMGPVEVWEFAGCPRHGFDKKLPNPAGFSKMVCSAGHLSSRAPGAARFLETHKLAWPDSVGSRHCGK